MKTILGFLSLILMAVVLAQVFEAESGITFAMAIAAYGKVCEKNTGGNTRVFLTETALITSVTVTAGEIAAITAVAAFQEVQADIDSVVRTEVAEGRRANISYTHRVEMKFAKPSVELNIFRDSLSASSPCGIAAIVQDANGECWLVGWNETDEGNRGLFLAQDDTNTGALPNEEDGNVITVALETLSGYLDIPFDDTLTASILDDSAPFLNLVA